MRARHVGLAIALALAAAVTNAIDTAHADAASGRAARTLIDAVTTQAPTLDRAVLELALRATSCAERSGQLRRPSILTVIDYSLPSTARRLWVLDLARRRLLHEELVAHGRGSGENVAMRFSNEPGSRQSSVGLFVTGDTYVGRHGRSLRLHGLEPGVNDRAFDRAVVVHAAPYVSERFVARHGRIGRSWGCPALAPEVAPRVIDTIRGGSAIFAYHPQRDWLQMSPFLTACRTSTARRSAAAPDHGS
jgi:hypothetical protein